MRAKPQFDPRPVQFDDQTRLDFQTGVISEISAESATAESAAAAGVGQIAGNGSVVAESAAGDATAERGA